MSQFGHDRGSRMLHERLVPVDKVVADTARRRIVRECPDDYEAILEALGLA